MDENINKIITKYLDTLRYMGFEIKESYLFGSYATGKASQWSDIDIALVFDRFEQDRIDLLAELSFISSKQDSRIEAHPFLKSKFNKNQVFPSEILNTGIRIS